jgi:hypothetical protein
MITASAEPTRPVRSSMWQCLGPVATLLFLSPVVAELLSGSARVTTLFVLIPSTGVWGCAALIIRELARRRGRTWRSVMMLGVALAVAEECVIQQTSLAPLIGIDPAHLYGRALGVNWVYFLWALGFESVWAVVLPIGLTEYLFPARRGEPWLKMRGLIISAVIFGLASFAAWYLWTQVFLPKFFPASVYHPPVSAIVIALVAIVALAAGALVPKEEIWAHTSSDRTVPRPPVVGLAAFGLALPWYLQILLAFSAFPRLPVGIALVCGLVLATIALTLANRWSVRRGWDEPHSLAAILGIIAATLIGGFLTLHAAGALMIDRAGQVVFNLAAIAWLMRHARKPRHLPHGEGQG